MNQTNNFSNNHTYDEKGIKNISCTTINISSKNSPFENYDILNSLNGDAYSHEIIAKAMSKGKIQLPIGVHEDWLTNSNHFLNNSSHGVSDALNCSNHSASTDNELDLSNHSSDDNSSNKVIISRYVDKISVKQRFSTEYNDNFKIHKLTPNGRNMPKIT
jgi:hypothetical protein